MKQLFFILAFVCIKAAFGQQVKFKKTFTDKEHRHLVSVLRDCLSYAAHLKFSYSSDALFNSRVGQDTPSSPEEIERLKGTLKGNDEDADTYLSISGHYSVLKMNREADEYRNKAIAIEERLIGQYPDSVNPYLFLASVYNGGLSFDKSIEYNRKAMQARPGFTAPLMSIATTYLVTYQLDSAMQHIRSFLTAYPDDKRIYSLLPMYYLEDFILRIQKGEDPNEIMRSNRLLEMPLMDEVYQKHKNDKDIEFLYRVSQQVLLVPAIVMSSTTDSLFNPVDIKFKVPSNYKDELSSAKAYFEKCLKGSDTSYYYYANKLLGSIYLLENQPKKALPYLRKTIDLKPLSNCSSTSNSNEDYYNLLSAYVILKDTAGYEKLMLEKIRVQPSINPNPQDYADLASLYLCCGKHELAKTYYQQAVDIDTRYENMIDIGVHTNALTGLGCLAFIDNDLDGAMDYVNRTYKIDPRQWELFALYASILIQQNDVNNAYETVNILKTMHDRQWIKEDLLDYFFVVE